jgi:hypothetical protein
MDEKTHRLDIAYGSGQGPKRMDHQTTVQDLATATPQGNIMDSCPYGVVQGAWMSGSIDAGVF